MAELFSDYLCGDSISFKHARGSSDRSGKEFHIYHEIILFLDGDAEFISENLHMRLSPATLIVIPSQTYHQMIIHGKPENYHRCILQFGDQPELEPLLKATMHAVQVFMSNRDVRFLFDKLIRATGDASHPDLLLRSVLILLLDALQTPKNIPDEENHQNEIVRMAIAYINRHLHKPLTIHAIAQACNTSDSSLSHIFKKEMYISIHKFIVKKRLMQAYHRICAGEPATAVATECGFGDYSGFYKQYKNIFGFPPSHKRRDMEP